MQAYLVELAEVPKSETGLHLFSLPRDNSAERLDAFLADESVPIVLRHKVAEAVMNKRLQLTEEEKNLTYAEVIARGEARGRLDGMRAAVLTVGALRPECLTPELREEVAGAGVERLEEILTALASEH